MISTEQYGQLTSLIKLWAAECKCNRKKTMFLRILYYLYCDRVLEQQSFLNFTNSIILEEYTQSNVNICVESTNITQDKTDNGSVNSQQNQANESPLKLRPLRRTNYPESIRHKIQFFESLSSKQADNDKSRSTRIIESREDVPSCPPPVVVGMILKQKHFENKPEDCGENPNLCSVMSNKNEGIERFLINLLEPRGTKHVKKATDINGSIINMDSQLYIKPHEEEKYQKPDSVEKSVNVLNDTICDLVNKAYDQSKIITQARKAVEVCRRSKVFYDSIQRAEAERIFLAASLKRAHYLQRIERQKLQVSCQENKNTADVTISNIKFPFNVEEIDPKQRLWYLVTCLTDSQLYVSSMLELNSKRPYLQLPDMYIFEGVTPDFAIKLQVYELKSGNADRKKIRRIHHKLKWKILHGKHWRDTMEDQTQPAFKKCGWLELTIDNLSQHVLALCKRSEETPLSVVHLSASAFSRALNLKLCGFLTVGTESESHLVWDRDWCKLFNSILHFWNTPSEESLNSYKKFIDLRHCVIVNIYNVCVRANTLALEYTGASGTLRYYLSCDTLEEIEEWKRCIGSILNTLNGWKALMYV